MAFNGTCDVPGPGDGASLVACPDGVTVSAYRCDDRAACADSVDARTPLATAVVMSGTFEITVAGNMVQPGDLILFAADVAAGVTYRSFASIPELPLTFRGARDSTPLSVIVDPIAEAAVRLLVSLGMEFDNDAIQAILDAVRTANQGLDFAGLDAAAAAKVALLHAAEEPVVQNTLNTLRFTPTPDVPATPTPPPPATPTDTPMDVATAPPTETPGDVSIATPTHTPVEVPPDATTATPTETPVPPATPSDVPIATPTPTPVESPPDAATATPTPEP